NALLATGKYRIRAITRNPQSDKAKALVAKGAEVFKADLSNREDVKNALNGADIAFIVTNFWDPIADVGTDTGVSDHFTIYINTLYRNINLYKCSQPIIAKVIEEGPEKWNGKKVPIASERISFGKVVEILTKVTGRQFKLRSTNREETEKEFPMLAGEEMLDMSRWYNKYGVFGNELSDISIAKELHPNITTFEQYAYKNWNDQKKIVFDLLKGFAYATRDYLREKYCDADPKTYTNYLDVERILERTPLAKNDNKENKFLNFSVKKRKALKGRNLITPDQIIQYNLPLDIALYLNYYISKMFEEFKDATSTTQMYNNVNTLIECLTNLERVLRSPIPYAYAIHLIHTTWIFCLSLPFQLVNDLDWVTVPIVFLASLILLGVEEIADEIENPFGKDPNDLPIDSFCKLIEMELDFILKHGLVHEDAKDRGYEVSEHGDQGTNKVKEGIMEYWWTDAIEKTKGTEISEKDQAKIGEPKQERDEIKSNHEKEVNQYGGDSNV
ncbi:3986_t:CDS:2, partial [Racocetra fulgida]